MEYRGASISLMSDLECQKVKYVVSDVDDTITYKGALLPLSLSALYKLKEKGKKIILVTGGSAGWADIYIRQWPVDYVITESGALLLKKNSRGDVDYIVNPVIDKEKVQIRRSDLFRDTMGYKLSSDQYARIYDIAYDKSFISPESLEKLRITCKKHGANYAESSIHLNVWFGEYDKALGLKSFLSYITDECLDCFLDRSVYLGDSFNDQIMFSLFPLSIGMHGIANDKDQYDILPKYITDGYGGYGFMEAVDRMTDI